VTLRSLIVRMPARPTTVSAPCDTSTTRMIFGCSPSTARPNNSSRHDDHAVDRFVAKGAQDVAGGGVLDEPDLVRIELTQLARAARKGKRQKKHAQGRSPDRPARPGHHFASPPPGTKT